MRPPSEVRSALLQALATAPQCVGTWRELAAASCVGYDAARQTLRAMAASGQVAVVGTHAAPHARRPMMLYAPADHFADTGKMVTPSAEPVTAGAVDCWAGFR